jgi:recombination protein RecA
MINGLPVFPRGAITDISGPISSGRTALVHAILAEATGEGECCAVVDCRDAFDPVSASEAGVDLKKVLWVRAGARAPSRGASYMAPYITPSRQGGDLIKAEKTPIEKAPMEKAMRAADMILHSGGFGVVVLDLCETAAGELNSIPLSYWYRFRRAVENKPSRLVVASHVPLVKACAPLQLATRRESAAWEGLLFSGIEFAVETRKQRGWMAGPDLVARALAG